MSIDVAISARRGTPLSPDESRAVDELLVDFNARRPVAPSHEPGGYQLVRADLTRPHRLESARRALARGQLADIFSASAELPPSDDWELAQRIIAHWAAAFDALRSSIPGADFRAHLDDFDLPWDASSQRYAPPTQLGPSEWRKKVAFALI